MTSSKSQIFTLNYGGVYSFGGLGAVNPGNPAAGYQTLVALASAAGFPTSLPGFPGLQIPWSDVNPTDVYWKLAL